MGILRGDRVLCPGVMMKRCNMVLAVMVTGSVLCACSDNSDSIDEPAPASVARTDGAVQLAIGVSGSLQNPVWAPDGGRLLFTRWTAGYNSGAADLLLFDLSQQTVRTLVSDGSANVDLPGSSWNDSTGIIVFASSREPHDEIWTIAATGSTGSEQQITDRPNDVAFEPSLSPGGRWVVFESHPLDVATSGVITKYRLDQTGPYMPLTDSLDDARQPNWSPAGNAIVYQKFDGNQWDLWLMDTDGANKRKLTVSGLGDTDASFSPDGRWVVYSAESPDIPFANLFVISVDGGDPIRITNYAAGTDGAPSWSPDGTRIAFESGKGDLEVSSGTTLWIIDVPSTVVVN